MRARYPWLLFDADDTLFDFGRAEREALREAFEVQGTAFNPAWLPVYHRVNAAAWRALEAGAVTPARLRVLRFEQLVAALGLDLDPAAFSSVYIARLSMQAHLLEGAEAIVASLRARHRLALITNGLAEVQRSRLARSPLASAFGHVFISEELGVAKPDPAFFGTVLDRLDRPDPRGVLVVGDSLTSDIAGGAASGLDTCWFNPAARPRAAAAPTYEIRRLDELPAIANG